MFIWMLGCFWYDGDDDDNDDDDDKYDGDVDGWWW